MNGQTKDKILDLAENLFEQQSFSGFSYADIAKPLGIKNAAIHYYFPSKADLGLALIQRYRERLKSYRDHMMQKYGDDPLRLFNGFVAIPKSFLDAQQGCPMSVFNTDHKHLPDKMHAEIALLGQEIRQWLIQILQLGQESGVFNFRGNLQQRVTLIMSSLQGAMLLAKREGAEQFDSVVETLKVDLGIGQEVSL